MWECYTAEFIMCIEQHTADNTWLLLLDWLLMVANNNHTYRAQIKTYANINYQIVGPLKPLWAFHATAWHSDQQKTLIEKYFFWCTPWLPRQNIGKMVDLSGMYFLYENKHMYNSLTRTTILLWISSSHNPTLD